MKNTKILSKIYSQPTDEIPILIVQLPDNMTHSHWNKSIVLNGGIDCIFGEHEQLKMQVQPDKGEGYIDSFPKGSKVISYIPF